MVGAHGRDVRPVIAERDTKSVSAEETFDVDLSDPAEMAQEVAHLAARVAARLAAGGLFGRTVNLKLRQGRLHDHHQGGHDRPAVRGHHWGRPAAAGPGGRPQ